VDLPVAELPAYVKGFTGGLADQSFRTSALDELEEARLLVGSEPNPQRRFNGLEASSRGVHEVLVGVVAVDYLKGSVFCGQCGSRLGVTNARNRWGTIYPYFYCINRAKTHQCIQPSVLIADVEASVADYWVRVQLTKTRIATIREEVMRELVRRQLSNSTELERQEKRKKNLQNEQLKLIEMRYADAIPIELLKSEQGRIAHDLAGTQQIIDRCSTEIDAVLKVVEEALLLCANAHRLYLSATPDVRRQLNQAVFSRFWILDDKVQGADLTETFAHLLAPGHNGHKVTNTAAESEGGDDSASKAHNPQAWPQDVIQRPHGPLPAETTNPGPNDRDRGSNVHTLVGLITTRRRGNAVLHALTPLGSALLRRHQILP
jgi:site-specific DNA recombinase